MKKILTLILVVTMALSLAACGGKTVKNDEGVKVKMEESGGKVIVDPESFESCVSELELTTENWREYLAVEEIDEPGLACKLRGMPGKIIQLGDLNIELENKYNGQRIAGLYYTEIIDLSDYDCVEINGKIRIANVPEEALSTDEEGNTVIYIGNPGAYSWEIWDR